MKTGFTRLIGPLALIVGGGFSTAQASPADATSGTVAPSPATMAAPVQPIPAAEAAATTAPAAVAPSTPAMPAAAAPASPPVAPAASGSAPAAKPTDEEILATRKSARVLGLKPRNKAGTEVYCKSSAQIGTHMETLNCYTSDQVAELQKRTQQNQDDVATMQRASLTEPNGG